jgi:hypothetical protein
MHVWDTRVDLDIDMMEASLSMNACASLPCASPDRWLRVRCGPVALSRMESVSIYDIHRLLVHTCVSPICTRPILQAILKELASSIHIQVQQHCSFQLDSEDAKRWSASCIRSPTSTFLPLSVLLVVPFLDSTSHPCRHGSAGTSTSTTLIIRMQTCRAA